MFFCQFKLVYYSPRTVANRAATKVTWNRVGSETLHSLEKSQVVIFLFLSRVPFGAPEEYVTWDFSIFLLKELNLINNHWILTCYKALGQMLWSPCLPENYSLDWKRRYTHRCYNTRQWVLASGAGSVGAALLRRQINSKWRNRRWQYLN